jgi:hypothetical protein
VTQPQSLALETYAQRSYNYFDRMVDANGQPYFNIFWTEPAEAAHDWPDFGDVMSRQLQGAIMGRHMTGQAAAIEQTWYQKIWTSINPADGLLYRPATSYSTHVADMGDQALTLYALVTAYLDNGDEQLKRSIFTMVDTLLARAKVAQLQKEGFLGGFIIKSLMACGRHMNYAPAIELAGMLVQDIFAGKSPMFMPDNTFRHGGHMHGNLRSLVGSADYALYTRDPVLYSRVDALYRWVRSTGTSFGFLPEAIGRSGDIVSCETCALMDFLGLAATLANHGHPEYWGDVERMLRNQMIESQFAGATTAWLHAAAPQADTEQFSWRDIGGRMVGGYAGWTSPNHILAARETLGAHWGGDELHGKTRATQNCCGGSGTHAFFIAWKNAARCEGGRLSVHLHIDKLLPQAEIRGSQPWQGKLTITLREPCDVRVRIPEFTSAQEMRVTSGDQVVAAREWGNYLELGPHQAGDVLVVNYPLPVRSEEVTIGNPGHRQYHYRATWKGDTVIRMEPLGNDYATAYSDFDKREVPVFYGQAGPGPIYQREAMLADAEPAPTPLHCDDGSLDFWYFDHA